MSNIVKSNEIMKPHVELKEMFINLRLMQVRNYEKYPFVSNLPLHASVYEQESQLDFRYRAEYILSKIIAENEPDATVVIVSHGGMINQLYQAFLKLPVASGMLFPTGDTGIHEWMIKGVERYVLKANSTAHLSKSVL